MNTKEAKEIIHNALVSYCENDIFSDKKELTRTQVAYNLIVKLVKIGEQYYVK